MAQGMSPETGLGDGLSRAQPEGRTYLELLEEPEDATMAGVGGVRSQIKVKK